MNGFGSLYYTDCRPGHGLQGGAGFQFQAATPGPATEAMPIVQRGALYEPPAAWMRERRPVADYPRSLSHAAENGFFCTAAGRYLGQEANGTRQGNQFTHAVVTRDEAAYGTTRPAQLWCAPWWADAPADGTELPELPRNPAPGLLDIDTVRDRVLSAAHGEARLVALLSAVQHLGDASRRRTVVVISSDPELAACWIAAATLLLPRSQALRAGFKIYVAEPQYGHHDIIALHPEWAGRWADTGADSGLAVFDLDRSRHSAIEPTASAAFWVSRFLREDAYDVVDAVELAAQFAAGREAAGPVPPEPTPADRHVALVVAAGDRLGEPARLEEASDWLRTASEEAMGIARDAVLDAVLDGRPHARVLRTLAAAAGDRGWEPAAIRRVRAGLFSAELTEAATAADGLAALRAVTALEPLRLPALAEDDGPARRAELEAALRATPADRVPALLLAGRRHGVAPVVGQYADAADRFARWWMDRPEPELAPGAWHAPPEALDWMRDVLRSTLAGHDASRAVRAVRERWWRPLWPEARDPGDTLDALLMSTAYGQLDGSARTRLVRTVLDGCVTARLREAPASAAWRILFGARLPDVDVAESFDYVVALRELGIPMVPEVAGALCSVLEREGAASEKGLSMLDEIERYGYPLPPRLAELRAQDVAALGLARDLAADTAARTAELAAAFRAVPAAVVTVRAGRFVDALLAAPVERALAVLRGGSRPSLAPIYRALEERWPGPRSGDRPDRYRAVAFVFALTARKPDDADQSADFFGLRHRLAGLLEGLTKDERAAIERSHPGGLGEAWWQWVRENEPSRLRRGIGRVAGALSGKSGKREG